MLSSIAANRQRAFLVLVLVTLTVLSYILHSADIKITIFGNHLGSCRKQSEDTDNDFGSTLVENRICQGEGRALCKARVQQRRKKQAVEEMLERLDQQMPSVTFRDVKTTTSAKKSKATLLSRKDSYCLGDHLMVRLDMYDHLGNRKEYGGDFLRTRVYSPSLKAGASGRVEDYRNGTYLVNFTLFWEGDVRVSILLIHPSEGVSALWATRKKGYEKIAFTGKFINGTADVLTECNFNLTTQAELCEYLDERDHEAFYCIKPKHVPCEAFPYLKSFYKPVSYLTALERNLFNRSNIGVEIPQTFGNINVSSCNSNVTTPREKCTIGMSSPTPSGFVWQSRWHPVFCTTPRLNTLDQINACLKRKMIYLMGDSTLRQWMEYLTKRVTTLKSLNMHGSGRYQNLFAVDMARNIQIQWKKHGHPFITVEGYTVKDHSYISRDLDKVAGDRDTAVVISLGQHFRPFPMELFLRRMLNVRAGVQRLLLRSPDTKVIIKTENMRETNINSEIFGDIHGYTQYLALRDIFQDLKVGLIDAWDMSIAYAVSDLHPPEEVVENQINMFFTYIC